MSLIAPVDPSAREWLHLGSQPLAVGAIYDWAVQPDCGAVVLFSGTVRDHAEGREGVTALTYEAYEERVLESLGEIVAELRRRWPTAGRVALMHRVGRLELGESSVVTAVSAPHRPEAFDAARFAIDALKAGAPIWKKEHWSGGSDWGVGATPIAEPGEVPTADSRVTWSA